jgi:hypothetical protein
MSQSAMQINSLETASGKWFRDAGVSSIGVSVKPETHNRHKHNTVKNNFTNLHIICESSVMPIFQPKVCFMKWKK